MRRRKKGLLVIVVIAAIIVMAVSYIRDSMARVYYVDVILDRLPGSRVEVPLVVSVRDNNGNGVPDALDMVEGARREKTNGTRYDAAYYQGGYPPEGRGACTDVVWRAMAAAGYDLKEMMDADISENPSAYGSTAENPDPNIDFRRVRNQVVFFRRHGLELTTEVKPGDVDNLIQWQPGDIVVFDHPHEHIGIISDQRRREGIPLVIHNAGPVASEEDILLRWPSRISHHFRYPGE